ncbi:uncharacterized protein KGF55_000152 [Candida pseudojiufengensis]|uniref:uncharacterized protein n=1 Tax=Candida pseudojiufengensis TaxID=497109 RepID=UPI00222545F8|nr:uncharacterized protein KGF55_000152 [Candida pseudojiufengensis]KAI5966743.1 hypothetical protein KGF55_000152 [Candida pseudojiufengensis]
MGESITQIPNGNNASKEPQSQISQKTIIPPYKPNIITSLDCKILQYEYGIYKLKKFIQSLKRLQTLENELPLLHYITLLTGNTFAINDKAFDSKFEKLSHFHPVNVGVINISVTVSHIPYDIPDLPITALDEMPTIEQARKCLKQLENLSNICLNGYLKRLSLAKIDKSNIVKDSVLDSYFSQLGNIISHEIFHNDIDLELNDLTFSISNEEQNNQNYQEASLIDMDIKELFIIINQIEISLSKLKPLINQLKKPDVKDPYAIHKIFLITQRLNDIYTIIRRFGRKIYLSNHQHLLDSKFLFHSHNSAFFKTTILRSMDEYYNSMKKNGTLIANITRLIRQDSKFESNNKNILNHINFASQGLNVIEKSLTILKEFGLNWIISERKFRSIYHLPMSNLDKIYHSIPEFKEKQQQPSQQQQQNKKTNGSLNSQLKKLDVNETVRRSRSSSTSSVNSNGSNSSSVLSRKNSLTSPNKTATRPRPNSMLFMQQNAAANQDDKNETTLKSPNGKINQSITSPQTRKRSNSQPKDNGSLATSGAVAALTKNGNKSSPQKQQVKAESIDQNLDTKSSNPEDEKKNQPSKLTKKLMAVEEEEIIEAIPPNSKLSASQRFQEHVKNAAKTGDLVTQQKETLTTVTYDPNNPSKLQRRKYVDVPKQNDNDTISANTPVPPTNQSQSSTLGNYGQPIRKTRDSVTRQNTQRNSHIPDDVASTSTTSSSTLSGTPEPTTQEQNTSNQQTNINQPKSNTKTAPISTNLSDSDTTSVEMTTTTTTIIKKVRFIGVPEYNESEDAPTKYSHAILRNFAVFRSPSKIAKNYYTKSDQLLKEESMSFKAQQGNDELTTPATASASATPNPLVVTGISPADYIQPKPKGRLSKFSFKSS